MTPRHQDIDGDAARRFVPGRRGRQARGIAIAVVSTGLTAGLAGCGPFSLASNAGRVQGGHGDHGSGGHRTNSRTTYSSGTRGNAYSFRTLDNPADPTFNQLLGVNNRDVIAGYFGSGAAGHPNKGYVLDRTPAGFAIRNENFPGSVQTQVTGLNDRGVTVGFWSDMNNANQVNDNIGFYDAGGSFHSVRFPAPDNSTPPVNQLLGVNDHDLAVGFYTDANGNSHGYTVSIGAGRFHTVTIAGAASVTAAAINNSDDVAGFFTNAAGTTDAFLRTSGGRDYTLAYPGASMTQALGVNDSREVVGVYTVGSGSNAVTHGFTWTPGRGFRTVDDPQGKGTTTINGVNDQGDIVGFYVDGAGNTDGFAAVPGGQNPLPGLGGAAPTPSMSPSSTPTSTMSPSSMPTSTMSPSSTPTPSTSPAPSTSPTGGATPPQSPPADPTVVPTHW